MTKNLPPQNVPALYVGVMSGTSVDGIDVVIAHFKNPSPHMLYSQCTPFSKHSRSQIEQLIQSPNDTSLDNLGTLHTALGHEYADAIILALEHCGIPPQDIAGIGCHGQTVRHQPTLPHPFSLQLGDANIIAEKTGITTVSDFRSRDIASGGQGAPLVPSFHQAVFTDDHKNRVIVNIGGIANITYLSHSSPVMGFDVGVGNTLMDLICKKHFDCDYDNNGLIASKGKVDTQLMTQLCRDDYFKIPPPKSTGRELFNEAWLQKHVNQTHTSPEDLITTLCEFTAWGVAESVKNYCTPCDEIIICGGGAYNSHLMNRIKSLTQINQAQPSIKTSDELGVPAQDVEALAFAWLAMRALTGQTNNCPEATQAKGQRILGAIHLGTYA